jgi:murein DD-endopeptidase MepM/ murein hydrolase activator NlpD
MNINLNFSFPLITISGFSLIGVIINQVIKRIKLKYKNLHNFFYQVIIFKVIRKPCEGSIIPINRLRVGLVNVISIINAGGTPIYAVFGGRVIIANRDYGFGNFVII